jgi:hypothetical protein
MAKDTDWDAEEAEGLVEQYIKLMPYILRDFVHKDDVKNMILALMVAPPGLAQEAFSDSEGIKAVLEYKVILDSGDELAEKVKPVIKL